MNQTWIEKNVVVNNGDSDKTYSYFKLSGDDLCKLFIIHTDIEEGGEEVVETIFIVGDTQCEELISSLSTNFTPEGFYIRDKLTTNKEN